MKIRILLTAFGMLLTAPAAAATKNGFDLDGALVPVADIVSGGPPRDGIPALNDPEMIPASEAGYLHSGDRVLGVTIGKEARAYPVKILNWHEVVNDRVGDQRFVVSYCPLCGTGMVFASNVGDSALVFGVSGDSSGKAYPGTVGFWFAWYAFYPDTLVYRHGR